MDSLSGVNHLVEFESDNGRIREDLLYRKGLIPLRDGSLRHDGIEPYEYTTIPLKGEKGLQTIVDQVSLLNKYTTISQRCALHIHIGGIKPTEELIVGLHRLLIRIQDEIYSMFPSNYKYTSQNGFKQKDYCAPIKNIRLLKNNSVRENFLMLYSHYSDDRDTFEGFNVKNHPQDREARHKWHLEKRYAICNIIPLIWGSACTCEWRVHPPSTNLDKIVNWLFIITGIINYAEKHQEELANWCELRHVNLEYIMNEMYSPKVATKLNNYIEWRKQYMEKMDATGKRELEEDLMELPQEMRVL